MDWSKAKNIIIVALLLMDVFLGGMYINQLMGDRSGNDEDLRTYIMNILDERGVEIKCDLPDKPGSMKSLSVRYNNMETSDVQKQIDAAIPLDGAHQSEDSYRKAADTFLKSCGLEGDDAVFDEVSRREDPAQEDGTPEKVVTVSYKNMYGKMPLEKCYMNVVFTDGKITEFHRHWMQPVDESSTATEVTDPLQAVLSLTGGGAGTGYTIDDITLVYWVSPLAEGQDVLYDTAFPAWRITYNGGEIKFISTIEQ